MANQLASNPLKIDTPGATSVMTIRHRLTYFEYVGYTSDTDEVEVQDNNGNIVWLAHGQDDFSNVVSGHEIGWINGFQVPVTKTDGNPNMPSGFLLAYLK